MSAALKYLPRFRAAMRTENVDARHAFEACPEEHAFRFANGESVRSLEALARALPALPLDIFDHHREHYWMWVRDIVGDVPLAERFRSYGASGMDGSELRRLFSDLLDRRLKELAQSAKAPERKPRDARVIGGA